MPHHQKSTHHPIVITLDLSLIWGTMKCVFTPGQWSLQRNCGVNHPIFPNLSGEPSFIILQWPLLLIFTPSHMSLPLMFTPICNTIDESTRPKFLQYLSLYSYFLQTKQEKQLLKVRLHYFTVVYFICSLFTYFVLKRAEEWICFNHNTVQLSSNPLIFLVKFLAS